MRLKSMKQLLSDSKRLETVKRFVHTEPNAALDRVVMSAATALGTSGAEAFLVGSESMRVLAAFGLKSGPTERPTPESASIVLPDGPTNMMERNGELGGMLGSYELITSVYSAPLIASDGHAVGSLCVFDQRAISLDATQNALLESMAATLVDLLEAQVERAEAMGTNPQKSGSGNLVGWLESQQASTAVPDPSSADRESWLAERILESAREAIVALDPDGRVTRWNAGAERLYGYAAPDVLGHEISFLTPEFFSLNWSALNQHVMATGQPLELESVHRHREGALIEVHVACHPLFNHDGQPIGVWTTTRDLRGHGPARQALSDAVGRPKTLLEFTQRQARSRQLLERTSTLLASLNDEQAIQKGLVETVADTHGIEGVALYKLQAGVLSLEHGLGAGLLDPAFLGGQDLIRQVALSGQAAVGEGVQITTGGMQFVAPILASGTVIGVLVIEGTEQFDQDDLRTLAAIASQTSLALARFQAVPPSNPSPTDALEKPEESLIEPLEMSFDDPDEALSTAPISAAPISSAPLPHEPVTLEPTASTDTTLETAFTPTETLSPAPVSTPRADDQVGLIVLANLALALRYAAGVGGLESFTAGMVHRPEWGGDLVVLQSKTLRLIVLNGKLEDLPAQVRIEPQRSSN
jgi:PAS domain S-box-containing protein